ncbi:MAG: hypothetical protein U0R18_17955 [Mycobacterium sp.]
MRGRFGALGAAVIVLVCGPPRAGVTAVADALRDALSGVDVVEPAGLRPGNAPAVVVFVVSAAARLATSDCLVLDGVLDAVSADRVVGVVSKVDAHRAWRDTVVASRSRYPTLSWLGVTAAPQLGERRIGELVDAVRLRLSEPPKMLPGKLIGAQSLPPRGSPLRGRTQQARVQLGALVRRRSAELRGELTDAGAALTRDRRTDFPAIVQLRLERAAADVDDAVTEHLGALAAELALPDEPSPPSIDPPLPAGPAAASGALESRLTVLLGAGFGFGVAVTFGRFVADLLPDHAALGALPGLLVGAGLTGWMVSARRLLAERVAMQRWAASAVDAWRGAVDEAVALRIMAAERAWSTAARGSDRPAAPSESMYLRM